ncbi:hypothetical protein QVD99_005160 [Batrachochytrium dendrobatidis]|nr:hypothetical protein O5D80_007767 [Batrachochytrium dendrobatidis]KAK5668120.1 hypothetical protein QVD99_005160 [Batrachochytrium dendrobatidis]
MAAIVALLFSGAEMLETVLSKTKQSISLDSISQTTFDHPTTVTTDTKHDHQHLFNATHHLETDTGLESCTAMEKVHRLDMVPMPVSLQPKTSIYSIWKQQKSHHRVMRTKSRLDSAFLLPNHTSCLDAVIPIRPLSKSDMVDINEHAQRMSVKPVASLYTGQHGPHWSMLSSVSPAVSHWGNLKKRAEQPHQRMIPSTRTTLEITRTTRMDEESIIDEEPIIMDERSSRQQSVGNGWADSSSPAYIYMESFIRWGRGLWVYTLDQLSDMRSSSMSRSHAVNTTLIDSLAKSNYYSENSNTQGMAHSSTHLLGHGSGLEQLPYLSGLLAAVALLLLVRQWFLCSPVKLQMPQRPASIRRWNPQTCQVESIPFDTLVQSTCPHLATAGLNVFHPHPLLPGGHLQTMYAAIYKRTSAQSVKYSREIVDMPDGGIISLDWHFPNSGSDDLQAGFDSLNGTTISSTKQPLLMVLHGLTGGSHETYVQDIVEEVALSGVSSVVMNFRGCSKTPLTSPQLYSGAWTGDLAHCIRHIQSKVPNSSLVGCGFSLGSNILVKYIGETGLNCPLVGAVSVGNPFDLLGGMRALQRSWIGHNIYSPTMTKNLSKLFNSHAHNFKDAKELDLDGIRDAKSIIDFDEACTRRAFNYHTAEDYYRDASSAQYVPSIAIPTLMLSAKDDPVSSSELWPWRECLYNPHVILATTSRGGHLGWFEAKWSNVLSPARRWFAKPVGEFISCIFKADISIPEDKRIIQSNVMDKSLRGLPVRLAKPVTVSLDTAKIVTPSKPKHVTFALSPTETSLDAPTVVLAESAPVAVPASLRRVRLVTNHVLKSKSPDATICQKAVAVRPHLYVDTLKRNSFGQHIISLIRGNGSSTRVWSLLAALIWIYISKTTKSGKLFN